VIHTPQPCHPAPDSLFYGAGRPRERTHQELTVTRPAIDPFGALASLDLKEGKTLFYRPSRLEEMGLVSLDRLPFSIRILLECTLRHAGKGFVTRTTCGRWRPGAPPTPAPASPSCPPG
jgi:hypothetical protein